jgi:hypothetical protein
MCIRVLEDGEHERATHFRVVDAGAYEEAIAEIARLKASAPETNGDTELMQSFWQQIVKVWDAQGIVSDRVGLDVSIGAPLIEAARRALKTSAEGQS